MGNMTEADYRATLERSLTQREDARRKGDATAVYRWDESIANLRRENPEWDSVYFQYESPMIAKLETFANPEAYIAGGAGLLVGAGLATGIAGAVAHHRAKKAKRRVAGRRGSAAAAAGRRPTGGGKRSSSRSAREREARSPAKGTGTEKQFKQRGGKKVHYTKNGQPYVLVKRKHPKSGKLITMAKFIKRSKRSKK